MLWPTGNEDTAQVPLPCNFLGLFLLESEIQHDLTDEDSWLLLVSGREVPLIAASQGLALWSQCSSLLAPQEPRLAYNSVHL